MSIKLLSQCQCSSTGTVAVNHNHATADVTLCVIGAHTEVMHISATTGSVTSTKKLSEHHDNATAVCSFGADAFLVCLPNGYVRLIHVSHKASAGSLLSSSSPVSLQVATTNIAQHPQKGSHFTSLASAASFSSLPLEAILSWAERRESALAVAYATSRDELFKIELSLSTTVTSSAATEISARPVANITPLGRIAGIASLPISKITVVPEHPFIVVAAVHNRLVQIDVRESLRRSDEAHPKTRDTYSLSAICPQRSWLLPSAATTTAATHVTSLSVSGTYLCAGTSDGRAVVWDVRSTVEGVSSLLLMGSGSSSAAPLSSTAAPIETLAVAPPPNCNALGTSAGLGCTSVALPSMGLFTNSYSPYGANAAAAGSKSNGSNSLLLGGIRSTVLSSLSFPASSPISATAPFAVTSCNVVGAGTVFTTDMRGFAKIWLRPNASLSFEEVTLSPVNSSTVVSTSAADGAVVHSSAASYNGSAVAVPSVRSGAVGSRSGGSLVFAIVDALGVVSIFGEQL